MTFQEAERTYKDLRAQYSAGKISSTEFEEQVSKLKLQDAEGKWWQIGVQSGEWYVHDGQKWQKSQPPALAEPAPLTPSQAPEGAAPAFSATGRSTGLPARLFSATPAKSSGGVPIPLLIGVIAIVALVGAVIIFAGYSFLSSQLNPGPSTAKATTTPTVSLAGIVGTTIIPTLAPVRPTDTPAAPILLPTAVMTATLPLPTTAPTGTVATNPITGTLKSPTPTRKPAVTATPTATKGPAAPPGVYVTKLVTDPAQPSIGDQIQFRVSFLNTSGQAGPSSWLVKIFKCAGACTPEELKRSIGETPRTNKEILAGPTELSVGPWSVGLGACTYVASPFYLDASQNVAAFFKPDGSQLYQLFNVCH